MELERLCKRVTNIPSSISRAYTKDISKILDDVFFEYDIHYKDTREKVPKEILIRKFLSVFDNSEQDDVKICMGVSQNGNKCCRRVREGLNYCKTHQYLEYRSRSQTVEKQNNDVFIIENSDLPKTLDKSELKTFQIDGTFYYVDDSFVYDKNTLERVGYTEGSRYVLTDDPFILCL